MLLSTLKKIGCKCLMRVVDLCREGAFQLNGDSYSPRGSRKYHIHSPENTYSTTKIAKEKAKQWLNDTLFRLNLRN
jgi:hypothetical protein